MGSKPTLTKHIIFIHYLSFCFDGETEIRDVPQVSYHLYKFHTHTFLLELLILADQ